MTALQLLPIRATLTHDTLLLERDVVRAMLAEAYDEGNRRPRGERNPYRSDDDPE